MNSRVIGPAVAGVVTLGLLGGAVIAQATADTPVKPVYLAPVALHCPANPAAVSPGRDLTGTATLVPPLAVSGLICDYSLPSVVATSLAARESAAIIAGLNAGHTSPSATPPPMASCTSIADPPVAIRARGPWLVQLRYGTRADVAVTVDKVCGRLIAFNGVAISEVPAGALEPAPAAIETPKPAAEGASQSEG